MTTLQQKKKIRILQSILLFYFGGVIGFMLKGLPNAKVNEAPVLPQFSIEVEASDCPDPELKHSFDLVAQDTLADLQDRFGGLPPVVYPIRIMHGNHPHVDIPADHLFHIQLGHIMIRVTSQTPDGVMETIATMASLQVLDDLNLKWAIAPPFPNFQEYHFNFDSYRALQEEVSMQRLPHEVQTAVHNRRWYGVSLYLRYHIKEMDADVTSTQSRDLQHLAAILLRANGVSLTDLLQSPLQSFQAGNTMIHSPGSVRMLHLMGRELSTDLLVAQLSATAKVKGGFLFQEGGRHIWLSECAHDNQAAVDQAVQSLPPASLEIKTP